MTSIAAASRRTPGRRQAAALLCILLSGCSFFSRTKNNIYSIDLATGFLRQLSDIRPGPAPADSPKSAPQRAQLEKEQRDLFQSVRDLLRADSIAKADADLRRSLGLKPIYLMRGEQISDVTASADEYRRVNMLLLRNTSPVNFLDGCALSIPCHAEGEAPVGLMLAGRRMHDGALLSLGLAVERIVAPLLLGSRT